MGEATLLGETAEAAGVTGVVGAWDELILGAPPDEGVAAADWLRELRGTYRQYIELHYMWSFYLESISHIYPSIFS